MYLEKELEKKDQRINRLQDLYLDGSVSSDDYNLMRQRYFSEKVSIQGKLSEIKSLRSDIKSSLYKGIGVLSNIGDIYRKAKLNDKIRIISSIFPENLIFDGKKCRTPRINEVLCLILLIDNDGQNNKSGQISELLDLSAQVENKGVPSVIP